MDVLILLTGQIGAGKSAIADALVLRYGARRVSTREILEARAGTDDRATLQDLGAQLDAADSGAWVAEAFSERLLPGMQHDRIVIIDSIRTLEQAVAFRGIFGRVVLHVHVTAHEEARRDRYSQRAEAHSQSFDEASRDPTEAGVSRLAEDADVLVDTDQTEVDQVVYRFARRLRAASSSRERLVDVLVGSQWGSEGKGNVASYLATEYGLLVRTGGPNSGHSVMLPDGTKRVQYHLPSGTGTSSAELALGPGSYIELTRLMDEIRVGSVDPSRLSIDPEATIINREHQEVESALVKGIGSTGSGVGAAVAARILNRSEGVKRASDVDELKPFLRETAEALERHLQAGNKIFVEGTQGTGLSLYHGRYPHVTSRDTTVGTLLAEAGIAPRYLRKVVLVARSYPIRVADPEGSTSGPLYRPVTWDIIADRSGLDVGELKGQEHTSRTKKLRRVGEFDWRLLYDAARLNGPTDVAVTFVDQLNSSNVSARRYDQLDANTRRFLGEVESVCGAPVSLISTRFHTRSIIDRRSW